MRWHLIIAFVLAAALVPVAFGQQKPPAPPAARTGPAPAATARVTVDVLKGVYHQAVAKQRFGVHFDRRGPR